MAESGHRAMCPLEQNLAAAAASFTLAMVKEHEPENIGLLLCSWDKYGGRVLGDIVFWSRSSTRTTYLSERLVATGHAVVYDGRGAREDWCASRTCSNVALDS